MNTDGHFAVPSRDLNGCEREPVSVVVLPVDDLFVSSGAADEVETCGSADRTPAAAADSLAGSLVTGGTSTPLKEGSSNPWILRS
jgi:hypothetical protein